MTNIFALRQRRVDLNVQRKALHDKSVTEKRDFTADENAEWKRLTDSMGLTDQAIEREETLLAEAAAQPHHEDDNASFARRAEASARIEVKDKPAFANLGEQLLAVAKSSLSGGFQTDPRLINAGPSGLNESAPSDGGFLVQKDFVDTLLERTYEIGEISSRVFRVPISGNSNSTKINAIDEDSRVDGSRWGGIQAYWQNEADTKVASKPKFRQINLNLNKLTALCYATDENLQDAAQLESIITRTFPLEMNFKVEDAILNGTGAGQPLGLMNSGAVIEVAKDSGDSGATVSTNDITAMWGRMWSRSRRNAVWLINQDVEAKLYPLTLGSGTAVSMLYTPPGVNGNNSPFGLLFGRPVIPVEYCATLGTPGDILLVDFNEYVMADKGGIQAASSIHVRFLNDETTFRFVYRVDGQPTWKKALTPKNGSATLSPFLRLATRS